MENILASVNTQSLLGFTLILGVIALFYYSVLRRQKMLLHRFDITLKQVEQINQQLALVLNEHRKGNRLLSEVAGIEIPYEPLESPAGSNAGSARMNSANESLELNSQTKLYVGNIDYSATEAELGDHFARFGQIEFVNIPVNRYNGRARGFGFVTFISKDSAERAIALNGSDFKGRQIQVNFAKERDLAL